MLQARFVPLVESGAKTSTIRGKPKREIRVGDVIDFRQWTGAPYRSKQRKIREVICTSVQPITIATKIRPHGVAVWVWLDRTELVRGRRANNALAKADGFKSIEELGAWFLETHGASFEGVLIKWLNTEISNDPQR